MQLIYNIGIRGYYLLVFLVSFFDKKAELWIAGRKTVLSDLKGKFNSLDKIAWFHCASLGEFEQTQPVLEAFKTINPDYKIIVTFFSPSGYEIRKNYELAEHICYLPIDTASNAKQFIRLVKPNIAFMCKYDIWPNYMNELFKNNIPSYLISASFRKEQIYFKWFGAYFLKSLKQFTHIFSQNEKTVELLNKFNIESTKTGDTRFDKVFETAQNSKQIQLIEQFKKNENIIILGSSWQAGEEVILNAINKLCSKSWKCIIAPHEVDKENIDRIESLLKLNSIKYSETDNSKLKDTRFLIIDNIGILSNAYQYANIAYIGGGFGNNGLHNILEPATFGLPVIFGPNHKKFTEAQDLINAKGGFSVSDSNEFEVLLTKLTTDIEYLQASGQAAKNFVNRNIGSTKKIIESIKKAPIN